MLKKRIIFTLLYQDGSFCLSRNFRLQKVGNLNWINKNYDFSIIARSIDELIILNVSREKNSIPNSLHPGHLNNEGASQSIESSKEAFDIINSNSSSYYEKRKKRVKEVNFRSKLNYFAFHLSNPIAIFLRNIVLKLLVKNRKFLENYLGRIYKN